MSIPKDALVRIVRLSLLALAGLLSVMCLLALASRYQGHQEISDLIEHYQAAFNDQKQQDNPQDKEKDPDPKSENDQNKHKRKSVHQALAERIGKRHFFTVDKSKTFSLKLMGVLGDQAYFQGQDKGYTIDQTCSGAKIKQIGSHWVEVEFQGKMKKLYVFGKDSSAPGFSKSSKSSSGPSPGPAGRSKRSGRGPGRGSDANFELTPEMIEGFKSMPAERRKEALEHMPEQLREKLENEL